MMNKIAKNWYQLFKMAGEKKEYAWVALSAPESITNKIKKFQKEIDENDLFIKENDWHGGGLESFFHITVKYGIKIDDPKEIKEVLKNAKGGKVMFDKVDFFDGEESDVLVVKCKSKDLAKIHNTLKDNVDNDESFPNYTPHITIAYLKSGKGKKYKKLAEEKLGKVFDDFEFDKVFFEDKNDNKTNIKL